MHPDINTNTKPHSYQHVNEKGRRWYDNDVLAKCIAIAEQRHDSFFFDVPDYLNADAARLWLNNAGLESRQAAACYCPWAANDIW